MKKTYFFGWTNIKWFVTELRNMYSGKKSYFSKKRIESGIAFIVAQWGMIYFLSEHHAKLTMGELVLWATTEFAVSGYIVNQIQKEKKEANSDNSSDEQINS
jgi:hypothetical protein